MAGASPPAGGASPPGLDVAGAIRTEDDRGPRAGAANRTSCSSPEAASQISIVLPCPRHDTPAIRTDRNSVGNPRLARTGPWTLASGRVKQNHAAIFASTRQARSIRTAGDFGYRDAVTLTRAKRARDSSTARCRAFDLHCGGRPLANERVVCHLCRAIGQSDQACASQDVERREYRLQA
jgi:hypothetical protein